MTNKSKLNLLLCIVLTSIHLVFAQTAEFVGSTQHKDISKSKHFEHIIAESFESFAIDTSRIYIQGSTINIYNDLAIWNFKTSRTYRSRIKNFEPLGIKKSGNFLVNTRTLEIVNISSKQRIIPTRNKRLPYFSGGQIILTLEDSILCYNHRRFLSFSNPDNGFLYRYDISKETLDSLELPIKIFQTGNASVVFDDLLLLGSIVTFLLADSKVLPVPPGRNRTGGDQYTMNKICRWDINSNSGLGTFTISDHYTKPWPDKIIGTDVWGNIYLLEEISSIGSPGYLWIFSPNLTLISKIDILKIISSHPILKDNKFILGRTGSEPFLIASFNENFELFFLANTQKGLYLFNFNYLFLLKDYYLSQSDMDLRRAINTIYARRGRKFKTIELAKYFDSQYWYKPNRSYMDSMLSSFDLKCINFLIELKK